MMFIKKYRWALLFVIALIGLSLYSPEKGIGALSISLKNAKTIVLILPPVLVLIGLLDVWIPREIIIRHMGQDSGIKGLFFAFLLGSISAGPPIIAFPIAAMLAKKGARYTNILFFVGVWISAKIPVLILESTYLGIRFTAIHVFTSLVFALFGSYAIEKYAGADAGSILQANAKTE